MLFIKNYVEMGWGLHQVPFYDMWQLWYACENENDKQKDRQKKREVQNGTKEGEGVKD